MLNTLVEEGPQHASELRDRLEIRSNTLHYHLDELVDVGLVEKRKRKDTESDGLYSYYRATLLGEGILEHGIRELMRCEWDSRGVQLAERELYRIASKVLCRSP